MFRLMRLLVLVVYMCMVSGYNLRAQDLAAADLFAYRYQPFVNRVSALDTLIDSINQRFGLPLEKTRALFTWVAIHLEYDCQTDGQPLRATTMEEVLLTGKSQCSGYASLLQYGLKKMGLEAVTIRGVAKTAKKDLWWTPAQLKPNHAWNAVKIGERWVLLDPTWASGTSDAECIQVNREFAPFYFDPPPEKFILSHLPADSQWQLLNTYMSAETFRQQPVYHDPFYMHQVSRVFPEKGLLEVKSGEWVHFSFTAASVLDSTAIWCEERKDIKPVFGRFTRKGNQYTFSYKVQTAGHYFLNVSLDGRNTALVYDMMSY